MEKKGNKFREKRTPKKKEKVTIEMNDPDAENPELVRRRSLTPIEYISEVIKIIDNQRTTLLTQIKQARDMLKILNIDKKQSLEIKQVLVKARKR